MLTAVIVGGLGFYACEAVSYDKIRVHHDAVLYRSSDACQLARVARAVGPAPKDGFGVVKAGAVLAVQEQNLSKEALCVRVQHEGQEGFLLASGETTAWVKANK